MFPDFMMGFNDMFSDDSVVIHLQLSNGICKLSNKLASLMVRTNFYALHRIKATHIDNEINCLHFDLMKFRQNYPKYETVKISGRLVQQKYWLSVMQMCSRYCRCAEFLDKIDK